MQESKSSPSLTAAPTGAAEGEVINQNVYGAVRTLAERERFCKRVSQVQGVCQSVSLGELPSGPDQGLEATLRAQPLELGLEPRALHDERAARAGGFLEVGQGRLGLPLQGVYARRVVAAERLVGAHPQALLPARERGRESGLGPDSLAELEVGRAQALVELDGDSSPQGVVDPGHEFLLAAELLAAA